MDTNKLKKLLLEIQSGKTDVDAAMQKLRTLPFEDIGHSRIDFHRQLRMGLPEVVYCQHKTGPQAIEILQRLWENHDRVLATRVSEKMAEEIQSALPAAKYRADSKLLVLSKTELPLPPENAPFVMVMSAGTSDMPVAEEAAQTLEFLGSRVARAYDVGVAGIHRLFDETERLFKADVVITIAGMEGALTSVVGGLVSCPVIGVPTSVGYGAGFGGLAPLLSMLNSCASGVAVVNIDNGFGAGVYAHLILKQIGKETNK
ncbi:MAG TPA: nickel pincer cofactor biosynthesis protein LarB [Bacteroidetes bacterium]|nr:nickel pincer cofactor biosynthesis protein LarB [Bacteroidota bacterium]